MTLHFPTHTIYTADAYAAHLGTSASTVRRHCREGRLPARKVAGLWAIEVAR